MRRGVLFTFMFSCLLLAPACSGDDTPNDDNADGGTGTDDEVGTEQGTDDEVGTTMGTGDTDTDTTDPSDTSTATDTTDTDTDTDTTDTDTTDTDPTDTDTDTTDTDTDTTDTDPTDTTDTTDTDSDTNGNQCGDTLFSVVRDFKIEHPDFQYTIGVDPGIVEVDLGPDDKPVYNGNPTTPTTTGAANFNQWYNDVANVNQAFDVPIQLTEVQPGLYQYANNEFFPIDDQGWGNEGNSHNYHFTLELHADFQYQGGEVFGFEGDDDLWVFVNGKLGIDLGGVHGPLSGQIDMDAMADTLGLQVGGVYPIDFFFAERHTTQSNFTITTTIACFNPQ